MSATLTITGLTRWYPATGAPTLDAIDLTVPAGGCVALLGPSGSGKSTALRLVAGLDTPDSGTVLIDGRSLAGIPPELRHTVLVFQSPRLFPHLNVLDNVAFPLLVAGSPRGQARDDAAQFLDLVGLTSLAHRRPATLSGGQEQRVALARALAARPDVLLLDEPFSALDPTVRAEMHTLLVELRAAVEPTILLVTHDQNEAAVLADTTAVLLDGRIAQHDRIDQLYARPVSLAVHGFLGGRNAVAGRVDDGAHHSRLGTLELPADVVVPRGPATLVVRQEAIRLVPTDRRADLLGVVSAVTARGARALVEVTVAGMSLTTESGPGERFEPGDRVGVVLPLDQRHAVPPATSMRSGESGSSRDVLRRATT
ncbi:putative spermidine/putrescine transport system ATP-binding protein [Promicromonospora umidemergens]|uniref:ABC transporter ATP-binding protein n=1 Tax=Promicromonospora umidemergens TaxID=629679 RepID=A0ABP8WYT4_9MICO|nr:ABC transporter ATP-binding protein [Promicromonospora umidemergens]MCP2285550.1 putative spermidine/putrescine transport system ATP-binding protein [Promicromonospora umidemergens]